MVTRCARWILACLLILLSVFWSTDNAAAAPRDANFRLPAYSYDMVDSASVGTAPVTLRGPPVTVEAELGNGSGVAAAAHTRYDGSTYTYARTSTPTLPRTVAAAHWRGSPGLSLPSPWRTPDSGLRFGVAAKTVEALPAPVVEGTKLQNIVNNLYKGTTNPNRVGNGTTMDAIRNELATGAPTGGRMHVTKGQESLRGLDNWLARNPDAPYHDRLVAQSLADELRGVLPR